MTHKLIPVSYKWVCLGSILHSSIYKDITRQESPPLRQLLNESPENFYNSVDARLTAFIDKIVGCTKETLDQKKASYKINSVENILKARDLKYASSIGLQQTVSMYIFSNRNNLATSMFCAFGGVKGSLTTIHQV